VGLPRALTRGAFAVVIGLNACALPASRSIPAACEFPDGVPLSFAGETTFADLGIPAVGEEGDRVYAWVTAVPIAFSSVPDPHRAACVERADGTFERSAYPGALDSAP
jgi:hypothetical protein